MFPTAIQKIISSYQIFGFIPLDKTLHFIVGAIITLLLRSKKIRFRYVFVILIIIEIIKETIDSYAYTSIWSEHLLDVLATLAYPVCLLIVIEIKKKLNKES